MATLINIHLNTHQSTVDHSFREKYRSAIYFFTETQRILSEKTIKTLQHTFKDEIITQVIPFREFLPSRESIQDYFAKNPDSPFCKKYIEPKLEVVANNFKDYLK